MLGIVHFASADFDVVAAKSSVCVVVEVVSFASQVSSEDSHSDSTTRTLPVE